MNMGQLALLLRAKYLVDVHSFTQVRGLPFTTVELADAIVSLLEDSGTPTTDTTSEEVRA
jgi:2-oxoglutarate ferredoxin oxidoreductase subunit alpha